MIQMSSEFVLYLFGHIDGCFDNLLLYNPVKYIILFLIRVDCNDDYLVILF